MKPKKVYHYRSASYYFVVGFLGIFSLIWLSGTVANWSTQNFYINDVRATLEQAKVVRWLFLAVGLGLSALTIYSAFLIRFDRVELEGDQLTWFDWRNRQYGPIFLSDLPNITPISDLDYRNIHAEGTKPVIIRCVTPAGKLRVMSSISDVLELHDILVSKQNPPPKK